MDRKLVPIIQFAATAIVAAIAALILATSVVAQGRALAPEPPPAAAAYAQLMGAGPAHLLKRHYLACDHAASASVLDAPTAMACSIVYEELKHTVFGGSFEALLAWWREAREELRPPR